MAQPTVLGTDVANYPTYTTNALSNFGKLKQFRVQAAANAASGQVKWEFVTGTVGTPNYSTNWRPYIGGLTLFSFDSIIFPHAPLATAYAAAQLNTSSGGTGGFLPSVTSGRYYTFNIGDSTGNNYMAVWETTFNPTVLSVVTQNPTIVCAGGDSVTVNVTSNQALNVVENAYLRYSLTNNFTASTLVQLTFSGTNGSVKVPIPSASNSIYFYVFTSKYNLSKLAPNGVVNERYCDLSTLTINNNSNSNYSFTVITAALPSTSFNTSAYCVGLPTNFTNSSTISSGTIASYSWLFGDGNTSTSSASSFTKTYNAIGSYNVSLRATSDLGCHKTTNQSIIINSLPSANSINAN
ncbi:MAG: PKD domain-containing protein [Bacteroidia bacterium]|nr:PKD domain-containing protein [Bacteroidia bacterium]